MASIKMDGYLRAFKGKGEDFQLFWRKFLVLCRLQKLSTETDRMASLPLFLDGDAFHLFEQLSDTDKASESAVKKALESAYTMTPADAFRQFKARTLRDDEPVDTYVTDLKRLLALSGHTCADDKDMVLLEQLLDGLSLDYGRQVRMASMESDLTVTKCVAKVRALRSTDDSCRKRASVSGAVAAAAPELRQSSVLCFNCNEVGHVQRNCPHRRYQKGGRQQRGNEKPRPPPKEQRPLMCFFCDQEGHMKRDCRLRRKFLASLAQSSAAAAEPVQSDRCLCMANLARPGLPKVFVDVSCDTASGVRVRSVIDTGSTRTLVTSALVDQLGTPVTAHTGQPVVALDGQPLRILGSALLKFVREDDCVSIPAVAMEVLVVPSLSVVGTDVLLGSDTIAQCGGLHLRYDDDGSLCCVTLGQHADVTAGVADVPLRHVSCQTDGDDIILTSDDGSVRWDATQRCWTLNWQWRDGKPPHAPVGHGIGEYSRSKLTDEEERKFGAEIQGWIDAGWMVPHDEAVHGAPECVLPLLAVSQPHKASTPVRPCLDYRLLNERLISSPGLDAPACAETLRSWRVKGPDGYVLVDLKKAYLQVRVHPDLLRYQVVVWRGRSYVMTRMGFGLNIAPKFMDIIVRWVTREFDDVDNYIDDVRVPVALTETVTARLASYGLETKPAEPMPTSRVLGLQLSTPPDGRTEWRRRDGVKTAFDEPLTKRKVFQWCGRLTSHYPVVGWLRPACSMAKRLACLESRGWDDTVSPELLQICVDLQQRLHNHDPVRGVWHADLTSSATVWCDASDLALGASLEIGGDGVEDGTWMRQVSDRRHINVAELDAAIKGVKLAVSWNVRDLLVKTDSKTVAAWLDQVFTNAQRVRTKGLNDVLIQRRLQVLADLLDVTGLRARIEWVPSAENRADVLTRVPDLWNQRAKSLLQRAEQPPDVPEPPPAADPDECVAAAPSVHLPCALRLTDITAAQADDATLQSVISGLQHDQPLPSEYRNVRTQLLLDDGVLYRSVKSPVDGIVIVPVVPAALVSAVVSNAHEVSGHGSWEKMYYMLRQCCFFPGLASVCQSFVSQCLQCSAANPRRGPSVAASRHAISGRPWGEVVLDVLELGSSNGSPFHCVLVCVDTFTKWVEIAPLQRHDAASVAAAFVRMCQVWGAPDSVRTDNGTEFCNAIVSSLFSVMGVTVRTGAVRHPQSQGSAERMNRTVLGLMRKVLDSSTGDWLLDLDMLLYCYRNRPHSATGLSPMQAMVGWQPPHLLIASEPLLYSASHWVDTLSARSARIRDLVDDALSRTDFIEPVQPCPYQVGDCVLLLRPDRHQKRQSAFEDGWVVQSVVSPSTVSISKPGRRDKTVNVALLKSVPVREPAVLNVPAPVVAELPEEEESLVSLDWPIPVVQHGYGLRDRASIRPPVRLSL
ncbi:uncharacterized protein LOC135806835 [Sycon ciliatum]|uniref:uncharacterized protein LOC135806835 n=1 Tax=Sycon ciliatum TaxID=27933 RepID=UPI0031F67F89